MNVNTAPAAASIVRTYPVQPQRWRQCRRTAPRAPCNKNILHAFCRFAGAAPHSGPGPVTDTQLPSLTTPACLIMRSTGVSEKAVLPLRKIRHFFAFRCPRTAHRQQLYHHSPTKRNGRNRPTPLDKRMPLPPRSRQKGRVVLCVLVAGFAKWNGSRK